MALSSALGKYSDEYSLTLRASGASKLGGCKPVRHLLLCCTLRLRPEQRCAQTELRKSITAWFYEDGELAQDVFKGDVLKMLHAAEAFERSRAKSD
jgi:hypothetical protein